MWLNKFKVAIIQKDADMINTLLDEVPEFSKREEIEQAMYLMQEGMIVLNGLQNQVSLSIKQIQNNIKFLQSSRTDSRGSFSRKF